jgi:2-dehydropantoate 2-reductase
MTKHTGSMTNNNTPLYPPLNWLVFGAGAIGTYVGGSLLLQGHRVTFLEQAAVAADIRQHGLHLQLEHGEKHHIPDPCTAASMDEALENAPFDAALFALKSFDTLPALEKLLPYRQFLPPLICFQNGVENETRLAAFLGAERIIAGTITSSVARRSAGDIIVERQRGLGLSSLHPLSAKLVQAFDDSGLNARLYPRPADMKWSKMLTNLVGNATSAILDLAPAQVFAHPQLFQMEIQQLREALVVMRALDIQVVNLPGVPVRLLGLAAEYFPFWIARPLLQQAVGKGRGEKMPSFHIDLHSGRGLSEVDYLNGAVVRAGYNVGVPTPVNALLNQTLLGLVAGSLSMADFARNPQALLAKISH